MKENRSLKNENAVFQGSRYATTFDYFMHKKIIERFGVHFERRRVLEFGCYHGHMTALLADKCKEVIAVDFDSQCIEQARIHCLGRTNIEFICEDITTLDSLDCDVFLSVHSLEHIENPSEFVSGLVPKGIGKKFIFVVPNGYSLSRQIAVRMGILEACLDITEFEKQIGHHTTFSSNMLLKLIEHCGMRVLETGGIMPKVMSSVQFDKALSFNVIDDEYLDGLCDLSDSFPDICASIYVIAEVM